MAESDQAGWNLEHTYAGLPEWFHAAVAPTPVREPKVVVFNRKLAEALGLDPDLAQREEAARVFTGNVLPPGGRWLAQAYAGHQYGHFTVLGDGRAILLGEQRLADGRLMDIQLKGPGRTPFSRNGDGRAALGPMLREYLVSEAMHALGIPTTRSLAVAATGEPVYREGVLRGAVLTRVAASHIRVGTFEWAAAGPDPGLREALAAYTLRRHDPELAAAPPEERWRRFLEAVMERQAALVARWMHVGFVHGVMNTDNMAISGETIDYGPCAFMEAYHPETVFSSIDRHGRYAYGRQPSIALWNLARLAEALLPLLHREEAAAVERANALLQSFPARFQVHWLKGMREKLGFFTGEDEDAALANGLLEVMQAERLDYTQTFRDLSAGVPPRADSALAAWHGQWLARLGRQPQDREEVFARMRARNPAFIPRNHKVEEALAAAQTGDLRPFERLLEIVTSPFDDAEEAPDYARPDPGGGAGYRTFCGT
jgi:uncharacterized protein YdiU (UPF0061 family)